MAVQSVCIPYDTAFDFNVNICEIDTFKDMGWFQFIGISYLTFIVVQIIIEM